MSGTVEISLPQVEPDEDDAQSEDSETDSKSLASSLTDYEYSNGRRYHAYRAGEYMLPNDEVEQDRMDLLHHIWKMMLGGELTKSKLEHPERILDVGTGTGIWAIEMADLFPDTEVIGNDLSPIQPGWVPENCKFYVNDAEDPWQWEPFDFIHGRSLAGCFADWPGFYRKCFQALKPGGRIEMQEHDTWINSNGALPPWTSDWNETLNAAFKSWGKALNVADKHAKWLSKAGFVDVQDLVYQVPVGTWAKDKNLKELGRVHLAQMLAAVEPYTLAMYTNVMDKDYDETKIAVEMIKKEFREKKNQLYIRYHFITARKPEEGQPRTSAGDFREENG